MSHVEPSTFIHIFRKPMGNDISTPFLQNLPNSYFISLHQNLPNSKRKRSYIAEMGILQASSCLLYPSPSSSPHDGRLDAAVRTNGGSNLNLSLPMPLKENMEEITMTKTHIPTQTRQTKTTRDEDSISTVAKLYAIAEQVADRAEMHSNIGEQRHNWNNLLLNSINAITLTAATTVALSSAVPAGAPLLALKLSATLLYSAATGLLLVVNKIQPSQLAEEQRNATRLFRQLHTQIHTTLTLSNPTPMDVNHAMERVLALDKAYPLPLLPGMLEKFPHVVEPTVWWPSNHLPQEQVCERNGWSGELEEEMRGILGILKRKDIADYVRLTKLVLKVNKILAFVGPLLTGVSALGAALVRTLPSVGRWAVVVGVAGGALAAVVNTLEHGGQVGMVFELYRNCGGFYRLLEESIESNLKERELGKRENGELFEMKLALQLGRSVSELRNLASSGNDVTATEFAGKLF
ncbi:putative F-box protein At4g22030 [Tasmannia lanceolata]|uniref:putative F-box protein At4g22030 n=1 Tax=Tasmannia lanceolata TaxID=3420 RepID=UPI004063941B